MSLAIQPKKWGGGMFLTIKLPMPLVTGPTKHAKVWSVQQARINGNNTLYIFITKAQNLFSTKLYDWYHNKSQIPVYYCAGRRNSVNL